MSRQPVHSMSHAPSVRQTSFTSGPLRVVLALSPQGRILSKQESVAGRVHDWTYAYDDQGRLARAVLNNRTVEEYAYGPHGRRTMDTVAALGAARRELRYDRDGQLVLAGRTRYRYDRAGRLAVMETPRGATHMVYGPNGGLEAAHLANGLVLEYVADGMGRPMGKRSGGRLTERFHWLDELRLEAWEDLAGGRMVEFAFGRGRVPTAARLSRGGHVTDLVLGADQVGTVKIVATADGHLIEHITYDSFGNLLDIAGEDLGLPVGFAGGVRDRHLGLVRFGHRDFDPAIGRFTAPDPLGDTGGDHDLWEYCVDDPVNAIDPEGLFWGKIVDTVKGWLSTKNAADEAGDVAEGVKEAKNTLENVEKNSWQGSANATADDVLDAADKYTGTMIGATEKGKEMAADNFFDAYLNPFNWFGGK